MSYNRVTNFLIFTLLVVTTSICSADDSADMVQNIQKTQEKEVDNVSSSQGEYTSETIKKISSNRRVMILGNENNAYAKGDFITFIIDNKCVSRSIVAKVKDNVSGIKVTKIYSVNLFNELRANFQVQIFRGDDSVICMKAQEESTENDSKIVDEDDLFNDTTLDDENLGENDKRVIKQDNLVTLSYGTIEGVDNKGNPAAYKQFSGTWAVQVHDNVWGEFLYGRNLAKDFPSTGIDTQMQNITIRAKYALNAPFYSILLPYVGYQIVSANAPGAKSVHEKNLVHDMSNREIVFGLTLLKRAAPGWFLKIDFGTDIQAIGFGLEF